MPEGGQTQTIFHGDGTGEILNEDGELLQIVSAQNPITVREASFAGSRDGALQMVERAEMQRREDEFRAARKRKREGFTSRDAILEAEEPWLIEKLIAAGEAGEEDTALGIAKLNAIENYGTGKGRVETYADGSMEWVPEGLPTIGEVFFDPNIEPRERFLPQRVAPQRRAQEQMMEKMRSLRESAPTGGGRQQMAQMREYLGIPEGQIVMESHGPSRKEQEEKERLHRAQMESFRQMRGQKGFQEGGLAALTGVGEPKMKEDEDQPLVPKPGNLISRTLGRIRKFFGYAEGGLVRYAAYAQGGQVRFAEGGALAAMTGADPDEEDDPSILGLTEVPGALAAVSGRQPAHLPTQSTRREKITGSEAMQRLDTARQRLVDRLAKTEADKSSQWLAMAQGMLAPTKTGGFGESLGAAAGLVGEARSERRKELTDIEQNLLDAEIKQQTLTLASRPRLGSSDDVYHPDDVAKFPDNPEQWRIIQKQTVVHSDGTVEHIFTGTDTGELLQVVSKNNPITVRESEDAKVAGREESKRTQHDIDQGLIGTIARDKLRLARIIFAETQTGGLKTLIARAGDFLNIKIADNADFAMIRRHIGDEVLNQLSRLTGTKTDFEYKKIESLNAGTAIGQDANLRIIDEMMMRYDNIINIGERAALSAAQNKDEDLSVFRYREYRAQEAAREGEGPQIKTASAVYNDRLVRMFDPAKANNDELIEAYASKYGWPPADPKVRSELRKKGAKF